MTEQVRVQVTVQVEQLMTPLALGWIERTIPDKPNSSKQKYRAVFSKNEKANVTQAERNELKELTAILVNEYHRTGVKK